MIPVSVRDILKILDQIPVWKAVIGLPIALAALMMVTPAFSQASQSSKPNQKEQNIYYAASTDANALDVEQHCPGIVGDTDALAAIRKNLGVTEMDRNQPLYQQAMSDWRSKASSSGDRLCTDTYTLHGPHGERANYLKLSDNELGRKALDKIREEEIRTVGYFVAASMGRTSCGLNLDLKKLLNLSYAGGMDGRLIGLVARGESASREANLSSEFKVQYRAWSATMEHFRINGIKCQEVWNMFGSHGFIAHDILFKPPVPYSPYDLK